MDLESNKWEDFEEQDKKGPIKVIIAAFIILIFLGSFIPIYSLKLNPAPQMENVNPTISIEPTASYPNIQQAAANVRVEEFRSIASQIVTQACSSNSEICYSKALYYYVRDNVQYVPDPSKEYIESPGEVLMTHGADCDGTALLLATLLEGVGIDADVGVTSNHAFVRAQVPSLPFWLMADSDYVYLDPTGDFEFGEKLFRNEEIVGWIEL